MTLFSKRIYFGRYRAVSSSKTTRGASRHSIEDSITLAMLYEPSVKRKQFVEQHTCSLRLNYNSVSGSHVHITLLCWEWQRIAARVQQAEIAILLNNHLLLTHSSKSRCILQLMVHRGLKARKHASCADEGAVSPWTCIRDNITSSRTRLTGGLRPPL